MSKMASVMSWGQKRSNGKSVGDSKNMVGKLQPVAILSMSSGVSTVDERKKQNKKKKRYQ